MANFKRKRSKTSSTTHGHNSSTNFLGTWPRWWDVIFHRRPARRLESALEHKIKRGDKDPDDITWPSGRKPHNYYW